MRINIIISQEEGFKESADDTNGFHLTQLCFQLLSDEYLKHRFTLNGRLNPQSPE